MNLKVEDHKVMLEFPLTQPKRAWKIRKRGGKKHYQNSNTHMARGCPMLSRRTA